MWRKNPVYLATASSVPFRTEAAGVLPSDVASDRPGTWPQCSQPEGKGALWITHMTLWHSSVCMYLCWCGWRLQPSSVCMYLCRCGWRLRHSSVCVYLCRCGWRLHTHCRCVPVEARGCWCLPQVFSALHFWGGVAYCTWSSLSQLD